MTAQDKQHLEALIHSARIVVRETGNVAQLAEQHFCADEFRPAIMHAYDMACAHLIQLDPVGAAEFIRSTYGPAFRQTGAPADPMTETLRALPVIVHKGVK